MKSLINPEPQWNPRRLGWSCGATAALFYLGCAITMALVPREQAISFFNALMHGIDVSPVLRRDVSLGEAAMGLVSTFILAWFAGALVAGFHNLGLGTENESETP